MYFNLALKNVKKSYKDYFVYFITLTLSVALFYVFNSFEAQKEILVADENTVFAFTSLTTAMGVLSYFVTFVFGFLILYANNFIMKRRKKEIALYTLLGMKKSKVSKIMLYETFIVGLLSLGVGLVVGIIASQGVAAFIGFLLVMDVEYHFVLSYHAMISTLINFTIIFVIVGIFNNIVMSKAKLIDLFKARQTNEVIVVKKTIVMAMIMVISLGTLGYLYYFVLQPMNLLKYLFPVLIIGSVATFGLFYSLSFWFVQVSQRLKGYYYRDLNAFTTRQISSKMSSTYKLLASVSLMLLLSFGSLATAFNVNSIINRMFNQETMYDLNLEIAEEDGSSLVDNLTLDSSYEVHTYKVYQTHYLMSNLEDQYFTEMENNFFKEFGIGIELIDLEDYNYYLKDENRDPVSLKDGEVLYFVSESMFLGQNSTENILVDDIKLAGVDLHVKNHVGNYSDLGSSISNSGFNLVLNTNTLEAVKSATEDYQIEGLSTLVKTNININFTEQQDHKIEIERIKSNLDETIRNHEKDTMMYYNYSSKQSSMEMARETTLLLTFVGLYLGLTFIIVCVMVLSLQLLSEANDNYDRYLLLNKIGVNSKIQKRSIFKQNLIYFAMPLLVALVHSFVGIKAVNDTMAFGGLQTKSLNGIFLGVGILVAIYLIYFIVTYFSSVRMIFDRKKTYKD